MTDDRNDFDDTEFETTATFLASIYIDGEATSDQRALVETSTEALTEVRQLGDVRTVLLNTAPEASLSEREGHLAAALDVWERMADQERTGDATPGIGAAVITQATPRRSGRSSRRGASPRRSQWVLAAAASLILIAGVGVVVRGVLTGEDSTTTDAVVAPAAADAASEADALEIAEAEEVAGGNVGDELDPSVSDLSELAAEPGLFPADDAEESATIAASDEAPAAVEDAPGSEQPAPPPEIPLLAIDTPEDLGVYGTLAVPTATGEVDRNADIDFEAPFGSCESELGVQKQLEPVIYLGIEVVVGVDLDNRVVYAYTASDCTVVERVALPDDTRDVSAPITASP